MPNPFQRYLGGAGVNELAWPPLPEARPVRAFLGNLPAGDNDIYTVPVGKRALINSAFGFNPTVGAIVIVRKVKIGGIYFRLQAAAGTSIGANLNFSSSNTYILEAGEAYAINTSALGLNAGVLVNEFEDSITFLRMIRVNDLPLGDTVLYTCPAGRKARVVDMNSITTQNVAAVPFMINDTAGSRVIQWFLVPSGLAIDATTRIQQQTVAAGGLGNAAIATSLEAGDQIAINTDSGLAGQHAWLAVAEFSI